MTPDAAAASLVMVGELDVRDALASVQCPTLVLRRANDAFVDERHSRYAANHIPNAQYVEIPPDGKTADEIEQFVTGARPPVVSDRVLATVLFTDIVGSTEHAAQLGDGAWRELLERHDSLVREEVQRHRGRFVKSLGDGALAVFDGPSRAISSATAIRDRVRELGLEIRAGLHTGECELLADNDVGGIAVHIGARVSSLAGPGEVLGQRHRPRPHRRLGPDADRPRGARPQGRPGAVADLRRRDVGRERIGAAAEGQGFEPWVRHDRTTVFETAPFNHSGTPPGRGQSSAGRRRTS